MTSAERIVELEVENAALHAQVRALQTCVQECEEYCARLAEMTTLMTTDQLVSFLGWSRRRVLYRIHRVPHGRYGNTYIADVNDVMYWNLCHRDVPPPP